MFLICTLILKNIFLFFTEAKTRAWDYFSLRCPTVNGYIHIWSRLQHKYDVHVVIIGAIK